MAGAQTRLALEKAKMQWTLAATPQDEAAALAVLKKVTAMPLGKTNEGTLKVAFKGKNGNGKISADDFYVLLEMSGVPREWVVNEKPSHMRAIASHDNTRISEFKFDKRVSELAIQNLLRGIRDKSGLKIRMGEHELGINTDYELYKHGDLHIHFESVRPDENGILYNYRLKINAHEAVRKYSLQELREVYTTWFGPFITGPQIRWPDGHTTFLEYNPWVWGGLLALGGFGLSHLLAVGGPENAGLLLGALPFLVRPSFGYTPHQMPDWKEISQAKMPNISRLEWDLTDFSGQPVAAVREGSSGELKRTKQFSQLMDLYQWQEKFDLIKFEYPEFLSEDLSVLPAHLQRKIGYDKSVVGVYSGVQSTNKFSQIMFVTSVVKQEGVSLQRLTADPEVLAAALRNKAISRQEWDQLCAFFNEMHTAGLEQTDFAIGRNEEGKLQLSLSNLAWRKGQSDEELLRAAEQKLIKVRMLEAKSENLMPTLWDFLPEE